jgi:YesN/AraC family two-component response regulator
MDKISVMLVDDDKLFISDLVGIFDWEDNNYTIVATAVNGKDALRKYAAVKPQLIICDLKMPVMDGLQFVEELKKTDTSAKIVLLTSYGEFDYARRALRYGVKNYILKNEINKPVFAEQLSHIRDEMIDEMRQVQQKTSEYEFIDIPVDNCSNTTRRALRYIHEHYSDSTLSIAHIAEDIYLSNNHLSRMFKKETGVTILHYITVLRIEKAKDLLLCEGKLTIYNVATQVGYRSARYFTSIFFKLTGYTPSYYRKIMYT